MAKRLNEICACSFCDSHLSELALMDNCSANREIGVANRVVCRKCMEEKLDKWLTGRFTEGA